MQITNEISWNSVNWPATTAAIQYALFRNQATTPEQTVSATSTSVTYDDSQGVVFVVRPTDGTNYGPAQSIVLSNGPMPNRGWLRTYVRSAISDPTLNTTPTISDDGLNLYINDAIREYSTWFPLETERVIQLIAGGSQAGARDYQLPADFLFEENVLYKQVDTKLQLYLKKMPFRGGETSATSWVGYPKLGIIQPPMGGRFYPGHYDLWEGAIHIDFDPRGNGDTLTVRYYASYPYLNDDITPTLIPLKDFQYLALYVQYRAWVEIEGKDTRLSRWRGKEDGGRRDDMPTEKMSARMLQAWNDWISDRQNLRPRTYRLVRR